MIQRQPSGLCVLGLHSFSQQNTIISKWIIVDVVGLMKKRKQTVQIYRYSEETLRWTGKQQHYSTEKLHKSQKNSQRFEEIQLLFFRDNK